MRLTEIKENEETLKLIQHSEMVLKASEKIQNQMKKSQNMPCKNEFYQFRHIINNKDNIIED